MGDFTYSKMKACFAMLKSMALASVNNGGGGSSGGGGEKQQYRGFVSNNNQELEQRIAELELLVQQRDNEIAIMVNMIRSDKASGGSDALNLEALRATRQMKALEKDSPAGDSNSNNQAAAQKPQQSRKSAPIPDFATTFRVDPAILEDPTKAFEAFKTNYPKNDVIRENKVLLKHKYDAAKELANVVNDARNQIKTLTVQIDKLHKQQAIANEGLLSSSEAKGSEPATPSAGDQEAEAKLKDQIDQFKIVYKKGFNDLSELKKEIQHIQKLLEMGRIKLQKDFDLWYQRQGKGSLMTEALVAQPKDNNNQAPSSSAPLPIKSTSPARPETHSSPVEKRASTSRASASVSDAKKLAMSTNRYVGSIVWCGGRCCADSHVPVALRDPALWTTTSLASTRRWTS